MKNNIQLPSLRPYLQLGDAGFCVAFTPVSQDNLVEGKAPFPFISIDPSGPLGRIIMAQIFSDAGSRVKSAFVLLQQDVYKIPKDPLRPFGNQDIEACWRRMFSRCSGQDSEDSPIVLSRQIGEDGELVPFRSLFYCKKTACFFHPPCPACGNALHQCYSDDVLVGQGLQPYSTSLKRYLFCPTCSDLVGQSDFFVYELEGSDGSALKDRWDLIRGFGQLRDGKTQTEHFPCLQCPYGEDCYGADSLALSRISPLCFYPSFVVIFPAMSVQAQDFLALLSGESFEELEKDLQKKGESGRASCLERFQTKDEIESGFFFLDDERHFLEVLYLKLCFLDTLFQVMASGLDSFRYPDMGPSLDRVWVKLNEHKGLMPFLWNFEVKLLGPGNAEGSPGQPEMPPSHGLYFMGMAWFYALLVNKKQRTPEILGALKAEIESAERQDGIGFEDFFKKGFAHLVCPENVFWDPAAWAGKAFEDSWMELWKKAVGMGWSLLMAGVREDSGFSKDIFRDGSDRLRKQVKEHLFGHKTLLPFAQRDSGSDKPFYTDEASRLSGDKRIYDMLSNIADRWRTGQKTPGDTVGAPRMTGAVEDGEETLILSPGSSEEPQQTIGAPDEHEIHETVILFSSDFMEQGAADVSTKEGALEETVIVSAPASPCGKAESDHTAGRPPFPAPTREEEMLDTVIISPSQAGHTSPGAMETKDREPKPSRQQTDVPETVIISPSHGNQASFDPQGAVHGRRSEGIPDGGGVAKDARPARHGDEEEEPLAQTVIIDTKKLRDKG